MSLASEQQIKFKPTEHSRREESAEIRDHRSHAWRSHGIEGMIGDGVAVPAGYGVDCRYSGNLDETSSFYSC